MARHARGITKIERKIEDEYQGSWVDVDPPLKEKERNSVKGVKRDRVAKKTASRKTPRSRCLIVEKANRRIDAE